MHSGSLLDPALQHARRVGLFGGSFDPPHAGHLAMARGARQARELEHVIWVPAARPPHKPGRQLAPGSKRQAMLECLLSEEPACSIWTEELEREGASYSIDTLRKLRSALPASCSLYLILGSDNLPDFPSWYQVAALLELAEPLIVPRSGFPLELEKLKGLQPKQLDQVRVGLLDVEPVDVSSTELRQALRSPNTRPALLPVALWEYLIEQGIYSR